MKLWDKDSKKRMTVFGVVVLALILAFLLGKWLSPKPKVEYKLQTKIEYKDRIVTQVKEVQVVKTVTVHDTVVKWKEHTVTVTKTDGTKITTTDKVVDTSDHQESKKDANTKTDTTKKEIKTGTETMKEKLVVTPSLPQWHITGLIGINMPDLFLKNGLTGVNKSVIYGAGIERRILGPIWLGAQGASDGTGALTLSVDF